MGLQSAMHAALREINFGKVKTVDVPAPIQGERLAGRLALITGGSGGIGRELGKRFAAEGCKVVLAGSNEARAMAAAESIGNPNVKGAKVDLGNVGTLAHAVESVASMFPDESGISILVNCAGLLRGDRIGSTTESDWDAVIDVNLKGTYFVTQAVANHMIERGIEGNILNVSSSSALRPGWGPYEISKWGIKAFTLGAAYELIRYGIVVNAIGPGPTATSMLGKGGVNEDLAHPGNPSGRFVTPQEVADLALVLVSDAGRMIVGDTLYVTGGAGTICIDR